MKVHKIRNLVAIASFGFPAYVYTHPGLHDYPHQPQEAQEFLEEKVGFEYKVEHIMEESYPGRGTEYVFRVHDDGIAHRGRIREELNIEDWWTEQLDSTSARRESSRMHLADKNHDGQVDYMRVTEYGGQLMPNSMYLPRTIDIKRARFGRLHHEGISSSDAEYYLEEGTEVYQGFLKDHNISERLAAHRPD